ncbi:RagB/SusD family nutrient uptake outer membrane protein [Pseudobacter ginsenosidimutans]|uniref:SusD-like starch-binding protein associating with outer membrane n=1 Tax=Pseudobacter ginsenosidimutans TaxID=661488 RepID=A0A4Q7N0P4_9BACT|nr:RagB/SusD family nutrient uptake outer membrane protein [Pseudobacter ginsenosidimutans]QEC43744.1 RagB/SusD family nutrient uptake outer membrane protein [Pseudobacter ginsenosidimutans]RZS75157.1 SusD-like starch-binding protein associating with outer membrane [Pseudobacter ginsenosidimutans]
MKYYLLLIMICCSLLGACNKFLDKNPDPTQRVPTTLEEIGLLSNAARNNTEASYHQGADEYFIPVFKTTFRAEAQYFYKHWNYEVVSPWALTAEPVTPNYKSIQTANASLELLGKIKQTEANRIEYNKIKGKCHYLRASNYMFLAWTYCKAYQAATAAKDLGMPIDEDSYFGNKLKRSTLKELYDYILKEAHIAYRALEIRYPLRDEINRINVMGLLARVHLSMGAYDSAMVYSNELLSHESGLMNYNDPGEVNIGSATPFKNFNKEMLEIILSGSRGFFDPVITGNVCYIDTNLIASYAPDDLRPKAHFKKAGEYYQHYSSIYGSGNPVANNIMMVDEFYLVRAECYARKGEKEKALKDLNDLLVTRFAAGKFVPYTTATAAEALDLILEERKKSLVFRGLRWIDIKRQNLEGRNIAVVRKVDGVTYVLPPNDPRFSCPLHSVLVGEYDYEQNPY